MLSKRLTTLLAFCIAMNIVLLSVTNNLSLYVHPRYIIFSVVMSVIVMTLFYAASYEHTNKHAHITGKLSTATLLFVLLALLLPARSLSQQTAQSRLQSRQSTIADQPVSYDSFTQDFTHFSLQDWTTYLGSRPSAEQVVGKKARVIGFIFQDKGNKYIARFRLSCCAVDATPLTITLAKNELEQTLQVGEWYEADGKFELKDDAYFLSLTEAKLIDEPEDPYVF